MQMSIDKQSLVAGLIAGLNMAGLPLDQKGTGGTGTIDGGFKRIEFKRLSELGFIKLELARVANITVVEEVDTSLPQTPPNVPSSMHPDAQSLYTNLLGGDYTIPGRERVVCFWYLWETSQSYLFGFVRSYQPMQVSLVSDPVYSGGYANFPNLKIENIGDDEDYVELYQWSSYGVNIGTIDPEDYIVIDSWHSGSMYGAEGLPLVVGFYDITPLDYL